MSRPKQNSTATEIERAILVQVVLGRQNPDVSADSLVELERLSDTAGVVVGGSITQRRARPNASFFIGEGKLADIQLACRQASANLVIFDNELSPVQVNSLDMALGVRVIDRTELILQIFARRARTVESQLQVELAQLQYLVSRIPVSRKQQRFQGGTGMRGPGESPLQLRNAPMRRRIKDLKRKLDTLRQRQHISRQRRQFPLVCLVGYTNAGKSTLLNALTRANAYVDDRLFATLDTKTRRLQLGPDRAALVTDTVGFIRHLPHHLVASFRSTLDISSGADLLLVTVDASHPHVSDHLDLVRTTLGEVGAADVPSLLLLNKCDRVSGSPELAELESASPDALAISARTGEGLDLLKGRIADALSDCHAHR